MIVSPIAGDSFLQWDPAQVSNYMSQFDRQVGKLFLDHNLDGLLLPYLTTEHLKELGIENLSLRLKVKRAITELIQNHFTKVGPANEFILQNANVNSNEVHIQSLLLAFYLIRETVKVVQEQKMIQKPHILQQQLQQQIYQQHMQLAQSPGATEIRKLNESFNKMKPDLSPALKIIKEQKPLPTPTLDPGSTLGKSMDSPTFSISSNNSEKETHFGISNGSGPEKLHNLTRRSSAVYSSNVQVPSPTVSSNRFSSGSLLLMGTGKVILQSIVHNESTRAPNLMLQKITRPNASMGPRFVLTGSVNNISTLSSNSGKGNGNNSGNLNGNGNGNVDTNGIASGNLNGTGNGNGAQSQFKPTLLSSQSAPHVPTGHSNEPLKQLRASSDDSCLKVLQQAMKRHRIPRDDWLKYVLVICYGDKERILKLEEKPVIIFKELQELGKHPAIMLRQLATMNDDEEDDDQYEDSRIGEDIPGGTL